MVWIDDNFDRTDTASGLGDAPSGTDSSKTYSYERSLSTRWRILSNVAQTLADWDEMGFRVGDSHSEDVDVYAFRTGVPTSSAWGNSVSARGTSGTTDAGYALTHYKAAGGGGGGVANTLVLERSTIGGLASMTFVTDPDYHMRLIVKTLGNGDVQVDGYVWNDGDPEPTTPTISATDSTYKILSGRVGCGGYNSNASHQVIQRFTAQEYVAPSADPDYALAPLTEVARNNWTTHADATTGLPGMIDEPAASIDDADYIKSPLSPTTSDYYEVLLEPANHTPADDTGHVLSYRYRKTGDAGPTIGLTVQLREGVATVIRQWVESGIGTSWTQQDRTLATTEADDITDYDDLRLRFIPEQTGGGEQAAGTVTFGTPQNGTNGNSVAVSEFPASIAAGDLLVCFYALDATTDPTTASTGWEKILSAASGSNRGAVFAAIATGTSMPLTIAGTNQDFSLVVAKIPAGEHSVTAATLATAIKVLSATGASGNANPPSLDTGAARNWRVFAMASVDFTTGNTVSAAPTNYTTDAILTKSANSTSSVGLGVGHRALTATQTEDPGTFTNTSRAWMAGTIAVPPAVTSARAEVSWAELVLPSSVTRILDAAALVLAARDLSRTTGAVTAALANAVLVLAARDASRTAGATTRTFDPAALVLTGRTPTVTPAAMARTLDPATLALTARDGTVVAGQVARTLDPAALLVVARDAGATPGAEARTLDPAGVLLAAGDASRTAGGVARDLDPATVVLGASVLVSTPGGVARDLAPAAVVLTAADVDRTAGAVLVALDPAGLALAAADVLLGVGRTLDAAGLVVAAQDAVAAAGAVARALDPAGLAVTAADVDRLAGAVQAALAAAGLALTAQDAASAAGAVPRSLDPAGLVLTARAAAGSAGGVLAALDPAALVLAARDVDAAGGNDRTLASAAVTLVAVDLAALAGATARTLDPAGVALAAADGDATTGAGAVELVPATLLLAAADPTTQAGATFRVLDPAALILTPQTPDVTDGAVTATLAAAGLTLTPADVTRIAAAARTLAPATIVLTPNAATAAALAGDARVLGAARLTLTAHGLRPWRVIHVLIITDAARGHAFATATARRTTTTGAGRRTLTDDTEAP